MPMPARSLLPVLIALSSLANSAAVSAQSAVTVAPTTPVLPSSDARNCPGASGGTVNYSNCTDPDGPGQGELHLQGAAPLPRPDLMLLPELTLGRQSGQWGGRLDISVLATSQGHCRVPLRMTVLNGGQRASQPARHVLRQRPLMGQSNARGRVLAELQQPALRAGGSHVFELEIAPSGGTSWLEVELDADDRVMESIEANNLRRVQIQLDPACR